jgi:hypothetical protein
MLAKSLIQESNLTPWQAESAYRKAALVRLRY